VDYLPLAAKAQETVLPTIYISNAGSKSVSVINTTTNTVTATVPVGIGPLGVAVDPAGMRVYVTNAGSDTVSLHPAP
jgi:YVTN family beta-propeller protein